MSDISLPGQHIPMTQNGTVTPEWHRYFSLFENAVGVGVKQAYEEIFISSASMLADSSPPIKNTHGGVVCYSFADAATQVLNFSMLAPETTKKNSPVFVTAHTLTPSGTGQSKWRINGLCAGIAFDESSVHGGIPGLVGRIQFDDIGFVDAGEVISCAVSRLGNDAEDTLASPVFLFGLAFRIAVGGY